MPLRTSFHMGSPDFSLNTFISSLPLPLWKPLVWSGFSMAPSRSAVHTCMGVLATIVPMFRMCMKPAAHVSVHKILVLAHALVDAGGLLRVLSRTAISAAQTSAGSCVPLLGLQVG